MLPDWLVWLWLIPTILFSFIGQGSVCTALLYGVYVQWLRPIPIEQTDTQDLHAQQVQLLQDQIELLKEDRANLESQNGKLVLMIANSALVRPQVKA